MPTREPLVQLRGVTKNYRGLRPLRIEHLDVHEGESLALLGFDDVTAQVLVDLITATTLPDSGDVRVFGQSTTAISNTDAWVRILDRFGLLTDRAVLMDQFSAEQNLAMPITLDLDGLPAEGREEVRRLAAEVGLSPADLARPGATLPPTARLRVRLGRALALKPRVLLAEHPNAYVSPGDTPALAADLARIISARGLASVILTADFEFARLVTPDVLTLQPATGALKSSSGWRRWFS